MKRKTNLFYLSGDESNFLTFSNYGESLTGNFLATNWKMFPSRFLCLYVKYLDDSIPSRDSVKFNFTKRKENFIKYLTRNYENKMAFLRDYCIEKNISVEKKLLPLNYLLESLYRIEDNELDDDINVYNDLHVSNFSAVNINEANDNIKLYFVGNITEQDYNGTYTDIISIINSTDTPIGKIVKFEDTDTIEEIECNESVLHGWTSNELTFGSETPDSYSPIFDTDNGYVISSFIKGISFEPLTDKNIKFNVLIPLYDLVDISVNNSTIISENETIVHNNKTVTGFSLESISDNIINDNESYLKNMPLGLWMSDNVIELKRNKETGYAPAWSLLLSSQFKPFPYSQKLPNEIDSNSKSKEAFATYAQVLMRQTTLLNKFTEAIERINKLEQKFNYIESKLNTVGTAYTSDSLRIELMDFEKYQNDQMTNFKNEVYSYLLNTWKGYIG